MAIPLITEHDLNETGYTKQLFGCSNTDEAVDVYPTMLSYYTSNLNCGPTSLHDHMMFQWQCLVFGN
jgi:hypothetical protein